MLQTNAKNICNLSPIYTYIQGLTPQPYYQTIDIDENMKYVQWQQFLTCPRFVWYQFMAAMGIVRERLWLW